MPRKPGRPSKFKRAMLEQVEKLCQLGATDADLAEFFGIAESTLNAWKLERPEFSESIKKGKAVADAEVANKLFRRATGYSHPDVHVSNYQGDIAVTPLVKHYAPDTLAAIFWLKNRRPDLWRDRRDFEHTGANGGPMEIDTPITRAKNPSIERVRRVLYLLRLAQKAAHAAEDE